MFRSAATKIAHNTTLPSLGGNKDLRPLQDLITAEKSILVSLQKLSLDISKASDALRVWGQGEGEDLNDTLTASNELLANFAASLTNYATLEHNIRDSMKAVRTREEQLDDLKKRRKAVMAKADSAEKKLSKMGPEHKSLISQTDLLNQLRDQIRSLDTEIMTEEAALSDFKRYSTRSWMSLKFGGLAECSEKGLIAGDFGKQVIAEIPNDVTQPGLPRTYYSSAQKTQSLVQEAFRNLNEVKFSGISLGPDAPRYQPTSSAPPGSAGMPQGGMPQFPMQGAYPSQDTLQLQMGMQREASNYSSMDQSSLLQRKPSTFSQLGGDSSPIQQRSFTQDQSALAQHHQQPSYGSLAQGQSGGSIPYSSPDRPNFAGSAEPMPMPIHEESAAGPPYLGPPPSFGGGLGLNPWLSQPQSDSKDSDGLDRPPQPQFAGPGGSIDDFGVPITGAGGNPPLTPRLGIKPGSGGGGRFATFPVKGMRQQPQQPSALREEVPLDGPARSFTSEFGDLVEHEDGPAHAPAAQAQETYEGLSGQAQQAPPPAVGGETDNHEIGAGAENAVQHQPEHSPQGHEFQQHVPPALNLQNEEEADVQLAYMSEQENDPQRLSRHVRFGEDETIGHSVGPMLFTPTDTSYSYDSTPPVSATGSQFSERSGEGRTPPILPGSAAAFQPGPGIPESAESSPALPPPPQQQQPQRVSPQRRVPPPAYEASPPQSPAPTSGAVSSDERSLNAAAARDVGREMESQGPPPPAPPVPIINTNGTSRPQNNNQYPNTSSPLSPRSSGTSPGPTPTAPPTINAPTTSPLASGPPSPEIATPQSSRQNLPPPAGLNLPSRTTSPLSLASYRTPPEYPRNTSYNMSNTSLASPTLPTSGGKISAAAFRRPPARAAGMEGGSAGPADVSPLAFKKKAALPSSPYPQRMQQSREPSAQSVAAPAALAPPPGAQAPAVRQSMPPGEDEDYDYLSAYMNGQSEDGGSPRAAEFESPDRRERQSVAPGAYGHPPPGYGGGKFSTNLDDEGGLR